MKMLISLDLNCEENCEEKKLGSVTCTIASDTAIFIIGQFLFQPSQGGLLNLFQRATHVNADGVPLDVGRLFKIVQLAGDHLLFHEVALSVGQPVLQCAPVGPQVDEVDLNGRTLVVGDPQNVAVFVFES
jgi:hypothetical protein